MWTLIPKKFFFSFLLLLLASVALFLAGSQPVNIPDANGRTDNVTENRGKRG